MLRKKNPTQLVCLLLLLTVLSTVGGCQGTGGDPRVTLSTMQEVYIVGISTLIDARQAGHIEDDKWAEIVVYLETADALLDDVEAMLNGPHEKSDLVLLLESANSALRNITLARARLKEP